jgi:hypothetical protein
MRIPYELPQVSYQSGIYIVAAETLIVLLGNSSCIRRLRQLPCR